MSTGSLDTTKRLSKRDQAVLHEPMMRSAESLLSDQHEALLRASAIHPDVAAARGYRTIRHGDELTRFGFGKWAHKYAPGLLVPYQDAEGRLFAEIRPDKKPDDGRKYIGYSKHDAGPGGRTHGLNVPPTMREEVLRSDAPLWVTEGARKVDALVSVGICSVGVTGVWKFLHESADGGRKEFLSDFDIIPLKGREVVFCFDSDAMTKSGVYAALKRFSKGLLKRGAIVRYCYLPDDGEQKIGADDFLGTGHSVEELQALVRDELEPIANEPTQALIHVLNKKCRGRAAFRLHRCDVAEKISPEGCLSVITDILPQKAALDSTIKLWVGDACRHAKLPWGTKGATLKAMFGPHAANIAKWETIAARFSGERDYFRDAAPFSFLEETYQSKLSNDQQDELLTEYLTAEPPMTREELRERVKQMTTPPICDKETSPKDGKPSLATDSLIGIAIRSMSEKGRMEMETLLHEYGADDVVIEAQRVLTAWADLLPSLIRERVRENSSSFSSSLGENLSIEAPSEPSADADDEDVNFCAAQKLEPEISEVDHCEPTISPSLSPIIFASVPSDAPEGPDYPDDAPDPFGPEALRDEVRNEWTAGVELGLLPKMNKDLLAQILHRAIASSKAAIETATTDDAERLLYYIRTQTIIPPGLDAVQYIASLNRSA